MSAIHFANPAALVLVIAAPLLMAAFRYGDGRRRAAMAEWGRTAGATPDLRRRAVKRTMQVAACVALAIALARPGLQSTAVPAPANGGDLVFLLDVSRSMLADDVRPSRLYRAREVIQQIAAQARGQRLALVAFAGSQAVQCPLTLDHAFFEEMVNTTGPDAVTRGGSKLGDAIRFAAAHAFDDVERDSRSLVLVSDGGDQENSPAAAARDAVRRGIRVVTIGVGDAAGGALVPESMANRTPIVYRGHAVATRLDEGTLRAIGEYVPAGAAVFDATDVYRRFLTPGRGPSKHAPESGGVAWMAGLVVVILLLAAEYRVPEHGLAQAAVLALAILMLPVASFAQSVEEWFNKGVNALEEKHYQDAVRYFADAARWSPDKPEIRFNLGKALYDFKSYGEAAGSFEMAANATHDRGLKARCRLGQGNAVFREAEQLTGIQAVTRFRAAIATYQQAQSLDPDMFDAEFNRKVAERRLDDLLRRPPPSTGGSAAPPEDAPKADAGDILKSLTGRQAPVKRMRDSGVERDW